MGWMDAPIAKPSAGWQSAPVAESTAQPDAQGAITLDDGTRMVFDPATGSYTSAELMAGNMRPGIGAGIHAGAVQGATLGWGDELAAALGADPMTVERGRAAYTAAQRDQLPAYITGAIGGGGATAGVGAMALRAVPILSNLIPKAGGSLLGNTLAGGASGAAMGAIQGAGEAQPGQKGRGAAIGGALGGAVGVATPAASAGLGKLTTKMWNAFKRTDLAGIKRALGVSDDAASIIKTALGNDDFAAAQAALDRAGPGAMLADSSGQASQLLDGSVMAGGPAMRVATDAVEGRSAAANANLKGAMDRVLGSPEGMKGAAGDISARTAAARKAAYDAAYGSAIDYASPSGAKIEAVLDRVDPSVLKSAIDKANLMMRDLGVKNQQIMATIAPDGSVTYSNPPNVMQLDYIKRGLDDLGRGMDNLGRPTMESGVAARQAADLRAALGDAVPSYRTAVKLGGDKIAEDKALQLGRDFMRSTLTSEDVSIAVRNMSAEARAAAKKGMRAAFADAMDNVKTTASDLAVDARQAVAAAKAFSSDANRKKAELILGKTAADRLFREFDQASTQLALRTAIGRSSLTAPRIATKARMDEIIKGGPINALKRGEFGNWSRGLIQMMTNSTPADQLAQEQAVYAEVAKALTASRGPDAKAALTAVQNAMTGAPISQAQADLVAKAVTSALALGAYQTGQQRLGTLTRGSQQ